MQAYIETLPIETQFWLSTFEDDEKIQLIGPRIYRAQYDLPLTFNDIEHVLDNWTPDPDTGLRWSNKALKKIRSYPPNSQFFVASHEFICDEPWCFGSCYYRHLNHPPMKWENSPDDYGSYCTIMD